MLCILFLFEIIGYENLDENKKIKVKTNDEL